MTELFFEIPHLIFIWILAWLFWSAIVWFVYLIALLVLGFVRAALDWILGLIQEAREPSRSPQ